MYKSNELTIKLFVPETTTFDNQESIWLSKTEKNIFDS